MLKKVMIDGKEYVQVPAEEFDLIEQDSIFLGWLRSTGVDNWEGYSLAWQMYNGEEENNES